MLCKKCKNEWETDQRISASLNFCPFCGESLADREDGKRKTFDNSKDTLIFIARQHGNTVLLGRQLKSLFLDYAPQVPNNLKKLVFAVYENGAASILERNLHAKQVDKEIAFKQAVARLTEAFIAQEAAENIIREFTIALGWQLSAQSIVGDCCDSGKGMENDKEEAFKRYLKAAEQGDADAQYNVGICYYKGAGVREDKEEAFKWYLKAAEQGHREAQCNVSDCYYGGKGVAKDKKEGFKWYLKSGHGRGWEFNLPRKK